MNQFDKRRCLPPRRFVTVGIIVGCILFIIFGLTSARKIVSDPNIVFLFSSHGADWIRLNEPPKLYARSSKERVHVFRVRFSVSKVPEQSILSFKAMKLAAVFLDGKLLCLGDPNLNNWKKPSRVDLAPKLSPGTHEIYIKVLNTNGNPVLWAVNRSLEIYTGEHWEVASDGKNWTPAVPVDKIPPPEISRRFMRSDRALFSKLWFYLPIFVGIYILSMMYSKQNQGEGTGRFLLTPNRVRCALFLMWGVLALNNIGQIPLDNGMDVFSHRSYIRYVAEKWRIPLAHEGLQMFQSPFFYIVAAGIYKLSALYFSEEVVARILRIIPLFCGAAQVELAYRMVRDAYPHRRDLQVLGTVIGGLLPMNLYIAQFVGNEPMAGLFTGIVIVLCGRVFVSPAVQKRETFLLIGLFLGLAVLTKITAILLVPSVVFFIILTTCRQKTSDQRIFLLIIGRISSVLIIAFLVAGWYYIHNFIEMGRFFTGGWDAERGFVWWQDPGYRTLRQFTGFGEALFYPIYAGVHGVWDSLYSTLWSDGFLSHIVSYELRPPWNYGFMLSGMWLSLLPSVAIMLGIVKTIAKPSGVSSTGLLFAVSSVFVYVAAILYLYLAVPIYSAGKATYMLGLVPCMAVLCVEGLDLLTRRPFLRAAVFGIIGCWAGSSYLAYFVWSY